MVRLKSRYILFEVLYPVNANYSEEDVPFCSRRQILLRHHQVSPVDVSIKVLIQEIRRSLQHNFGDYGCGKATSLLQIKYFSNMTSTGILRCHREDSDLLITALTLISKIGTIDNVIVNPVKVSGTIKKIEDYAGRRSEKLLSVIKRDDKRLIDDFTTVTEDNDEDTATT